MTGERQTSAQLLTVLIVGFTVLILLLTGAAYVAIGAIQSVESDAEQLATEEQATVRLIDEVQGEEGNLSAVFYSLAAGRATPNREELARKLDALEGAIQRTTQAGIASGGSEAWRKVQRAAARFIAEGRTTLTSGGPSGRPINDTFYTLHQNLIDSVAELASGNFVAESAQERRERERAADRVRYSLLLLAIALVVAVAGAVSAVLIVRAMFRRLEWQAAELAQLSSRTMSDQEATARRFSHEMHDHFGQTLNALEANLVAMQHTRTYQPERMEDCLALLKDAVDNIREMSQLLRPSILDDFGLTASLRWLAESFAERTGVHASFHSTFTGRLDEGREAQLFRIAQEALTNASKHAKATEVRIVLQTGEGRDKNNLILTISDNGQGIQPRPSISLGAPTPRNGGLGLVGMRARARAAGGNLTVDSVEGTGVIIAVTVPLEFVSHVSQNSHFARR